MKIVISDYPDDLNRNTDYEVMLLQHELPDARIVVHPYINHSDFLDEMAEADGLITAFLTIDDAVLSHCKNLKCISVNATGYNSIDLKAAAKKDIVVCALKDYCTEEVADFTLALMLSLVKKLKLHQHFVDEEHIWQFTKVGSVLRLRGKTWGIFGFGRIGQAVAKRAQAFGIHVVAVDPFIPPAVAEALGVSLVDKEYVLEHADMISNHMSVSSDSSTFFDCEFFGKLLRKPMFVNVGRGVSVDEEALLWALNEELVSGAGLDVLADDGLSISTNPLVGKENVIITPHAAFYSEDSIKALQDISCNNLASCLKGETQKINYIVR